jgi:hypothetical protein
MYDSPLIGAGYDLKKLAARIVQDSGAAKADYWLDVDLADVNALDPFSTWPRGVLTVDQRILDPDGAWDAGAIAYVTAHEAVLFRDSGTPKTGLSPTFLHYSEGKGEEPEYLPIVQEVGNGLYAWSARPNGSVKWVLDGGSSLTDAYDRYMEGTTYEDEGYTRRIKDRLREDNLTKEIEDNLEADHGSGSWSADAYSPWEDNDVIVARKILGILQGVSTPQTPTEGALYAMKTVEDAIKAKSDLMNFVGSDVKATLDSEQVDVGSVNTVGVTGPNDLKADLTTLDTKVDGIKAKTDNLPSDPASQAQALVDINTARDLVLVSTLAIDTKAGSIKGKTDQLTFAGSDVVASLQGEEVDVGKVKGVAVAGVADFKADVTKLDVNVSTRAAPGDILAVPANKLATNASGKVTIDQDSILTSINADVAAMKLQTDKFNTMVELDGGGPNYKFTTGAVQECPVAADMTADEKTAWKTILGIPATGTVPEDPTAGIAKKLYDDTTALKNTAGLIKTETDKIPAIQTEANKIQGVKDETDKITATVIANQTSMISTLATINTNAQNAWNKLNAYPADIWSQTEAEAYLDAVKAAIQTDITNMDAKIDTIKTETGLVKGLVYGNTWRYPRTYSAGKLTEETLEVYDTKANALVHDGSTGLIGKYKYTYAYNGGDKPISLLVTQESP